jgi:hypothetical protein
MAAVVADSDAPVGKSEKRDGASHSGSCDGNKEYVGIVVGLVSGSLLDARLTGSSHASLGSNSASSKRIGGDENPGGGDAKRDDGLGTTSSAVDPSETLKVARGTKG